MKYLFAGIALTAIVAALYDPQDIPENLDMPVNGGFLNNDEDEDAPELITYYGSLYEVGAVVFVLDFSGSMRNGSNIETLRKETKRAIYELQEAYLNVIVFHDLVIQWRTSLVSVVANKSSASSFVQTQKLGQNTHISPAVITALKQLRNSVRKRKRVILVADGTTSEDPEVSLSEIKKNNPTRIPIDTVFIRYGEGKIATMLAQQGREYLSAVSQQSGGKFREVR